MHFPQPSTVTRIAVFRASQKAVSAYLKNEQLLPFDFAEPRCGDPVVNLFPLMACIVNNVSVLLNAYEEAMDDIVQARRPP